MIRFLPVQAPEPWTHSAVGTPILLLKLVIILPLRVTTNYNPNLLASLLQIMNGLPIIIFQNSKNENIIQLISTKYTIFVTSPTSPTVNFTSPKDWWTGL